MSLRHALPPLLMFAAVLVLLQWLGGGVTTLPLKTIAVAIAGILLFRLVPWGAISRRTAPRSPLFSLLLFLLVLRHFAGILAIEARRVFQARALCIGRRYGPGWFGSLIHALGALFRRSLARAERFCAALLVQGSAE